MSFADNLRKMSNEHNQVNSISDNQRINDLIINYTPAIKKFCENEAMQGKNMIDGFISLGIDNEYQTEYYVRFFQFSKSDLKSKPLGGFGDKSLYIKQCDIGFGENENKRLEQIKMLKNGFERKLKPCDFKQLSIESVTAPRWDCQKRNHKVNYHLLHFVIKW